ncbi:MAG: hypothetical protein KKF52_02810 [Nanoarchaeota archaeon]|nr:hypothetical protein [Nanoarchaeota archaeon]MBU4242141.1 hypothetical protein [Nanoarchaeota archaeon]MBU4352511.1 hypothetical protein [Nanoarchaeota archaeon]
MGDIENIVRDMDSTDNWDDLERIFIDEERCSLFDESLRNKADYRYDFSIKLGAIYGSIYPKENVEIINEPLPATIVNKEVKYFIHGIVHDCLNTDVVQKVLLDKKNVVCERTLKHNYKLTNSQAQKISDEIKFCNLSFWYSKEFLIYLKSKYSLKKSNVPDFENKQIGLQEVIDENFFYLKNQKFDTRFANYPKHLEQDLINYKLNNKDFGNCFLRSLSQALFIKDFAKKNNFKEVHGLYGLYHENDVADFLRNEEKIMELVDRFQSKLFSNKMKICAMPFVGLSGVILPMVLTQTQGGLAYLTLPLVVPSYLHSLFSIRTLLEK